MSTPPNPPVRSQRRDAVQLGVQILAGVFGALALPMWGLGAFAAAASALADMHSDPHGYGQIFGMLMSLFFGLITTVVLPFAWPPGRRVRAFLILMAIYLLSHGVLIAMLSAG